MTRPFLPIRVPVGHWEPAAGPLTTCRVVVGVVAAAVAVAVAPLSVAAQPTPAPLTRTSPAAIRVVSWNVGANSVAAPPRAAVDFGRESRPAAFARIMRALDADLVCLQEYTSTPAGAAALFDALRPLRAGRRWQAFNALGNVMLSRYPLVERSARTLRSRVSQRAHAIARIDLPDSIAPVDPVAVCTHLQSGGGVANAGFRQRHSETILRDVEKQLRRSGVAVPLIVMGDLNAVDGTVPHLLSRSPDISFVPALADARPLHNAVGPERYTWRDDAQRYAPGVLDYILFSESAFTVRNAFVLNTASLEDTALLAFGLRRGDSLRDARRGLHDHLPIVVDLEAVGALLRTP